MTLMLSVLTATAQNYFDDKVYTQPVSHKSVYDNDKWHLMSIERSPSYTVVYVKYTTPYMAQGWSESFNLDDCLTDPDTGHCYPLIDSYGIPRKPAVYTFESDANNVELDAVMLFQPIPETVRTVNTTLGLYDIDLASVPVTTGGSTRFYESKTNAGGNLTLEAASDNRSQTILFFTYTTNGYYNNTIHISNEAHLKDKTTGKTYSMTGCNGITLAPEKLSIPCNTPVGFCLAFPSMSAAGVKTVDFVDGNWEITDINL